MVIKGSISMLKKPVFNHHFCVLPMNNENVIYMLSELKQSALQGALYLDIVEYLTGENTVFEITEALGKRYSAGKIEQALGRLYQKGFIVDDEPKINKPEAAFWSLQGYSSCQVAELLGNTSIAFKNISSLDSAKLEDTLSDYGLKRGENPGLTVVLVDDYLQTELEYINREALHTGIPWILIKPTGVVLWFGPLFLPETTGCWSCLRHRIQDNREVETVIQKNLGLEEPLVVAKAHNSITAGISCSVAASQIINAILKKELSPLAGKIMTLDILTLDSQFHYLTRRPQCTKCGIPVTDKMPLPLEFKSCRKLFTEDGGHRVCSPAETLDKFQRQLSPITGVVSEIKHVYTSGDGFINIFGGHHKIADDAMSYEALKTLLRNQSTGKGKSRIQAQTSAFSEAVERYSALNSDEVFKIKASMNELGENAVDIEDCMLFSDKQYRDRNEWNEKFGMHMFVPLRLDPAVSVEWCPIWSVSEKKYKYLPANYCYQTILRSDDYLFFQAESNGLAAGNTLEEAVLQGFFELVERDCVSIWWYNRLNMPAVDLDSFDNNYFDALREYYEKIGRELWVLDLTNDFGIPTFVAVSRQVNSEKELIIYGCGTHLDPETGVSRALTEINQFLYLQSEGRLSNHTVVQREHFMHDYWFNLATVEELNYLLPAENKVKRTLSDYEYKFNPCILEDLNLCFAKAEELGLEVLVCDMTRPDIGMNVVRVVMPEARQMRPRYAPGRLYDVPVKMGWSEHALSEEDMNPLFVWI